VNYEEIRYEGYGINGAAVIVDCMTDNRTRTVAEVRHAFSKHHGNMGAEGSVAFLFKHCGQLLFAPGTNEEKLMELALDSGAEDVITQADGAIEVITSAIEFARIKDALISSGMKPELAEITMRAENEIVLDEEQAEAMQKLVDALENLDDVQQVYSNTNL
jgi:YebC/PmpR family DNA-binding regulatory protein